MHIEEGHFVSGDGTSRYERAWSPDGEARASVVIVHGYAEHIGRYEHVARRLVQEGCATYGFDLKGHGRSEGRRAFIRSMDEHVEDVRAFVARSKGQAPDRPLFILGHSMGGALVAYYLTQQPADVSGAILSGAALRGSSSGWLERVLGTIVRLIARVAPKVPVRKLKSADVSRDPNVVAQYDSDPLVYRGGMPAGTAAAMVEGVRHVLRNMDAITVPLLVMHGTEDGLTDAAGSEDLYQRAATPDKTLKLYDGLYHEILNEPEQEEVMSDMISWLEARVGLPVKSSLPQG
jgi:alpha-beta hydrolase superfamily lysophospholipase